MSWLQCLLGNGKNQLQLWHTQMKCTRSPTEFDQNNRDVTSIFVHVIKENRSRGAEHGAPKKTEDVVPFEANAQERHGCSPRYLIMMPMQNTGSRFVTWDGDITTS